MIDTDDGEGVLLLAAVDLDLLAQRILSLSKHIVDQTVGNHRYVFDAFVVLISDKATAQHGQVVCALIPAVDTADGNICIAMSFGHSAASHAFLQADRFHYIPIILQKGFDHLIVDVVLLVHIDRVAGAVFRFPLLQADLNGVGSHLLQRGGHRVGHRVAHDDADDRTDADDDAQHGQQGAHLVCPQTGNGKQDIFIKLCHTLPPSPAAAELP